MGWSTHHPVGLIHYSPILCSKGYTLFSNMGGDVAYLIDMEGRVCHRWHSAEGLEYCYLLPDGNLLSRGHPDRSTDAGNIGGSSALMQELDWDGNVVWEYRNVLLHHDFERLSNGNTLIVLFEPLPAELTAQVQGGSPSEKEPTQMFGDLVQEITPNNEVVYEWRVWEHLSIEEDVICPIESRDQWTHQNALSVTPQGDLLVSFRQTSVIGIADRASGDFKWKWGPGQVSHQHHPTYLDSGRVLLFDNGTHRRGASASRVLEVDPETDEIAWEYKGSPPGSFYSHNVSSAERLPNDNTLICEGAQGRLFEVTPDGQIVWEYVNPFFVMRVPPGGGQSPQAGGGIGPGAPELSNGVFRAHRYGPDHPALLGKDLDPARYANLNRLHAAT